MKLIRSILLLFRIFRFILEGLISMATLAMGVVCMFTPDKILVTSVQNSQMIGGMLVIMSCMWIFTYEKYHRLKYPKEYRGEDEDEE